MNREADVEGFESRESVVQSLQTLKKLELGPREVTRTPKSIILIGGAGVTAQKYAERIAGAGLTVDAIADFKPKSQVELKGFLSNAEYLQLPDNYSSLEIESLAERHPDAALVVMTPQDTHADILIKLAGLIEKRKLPTWIDKPLALSAQESLKVLDLLASHPRLAHLVVSGGYTIDKATPELLFYGVFDANYPFSDRIRPMDPQTPNFLDTYSNSEENRQKLGKLKNVRFLFIEGRHGTREVIGSYGRPHLAVYPGGGITGDLLEHLTDKLIRMDLLNTEAQFVSAYLGYISPGSSETSVPWKQPENKGLAEIEGEVLMLNVQGVPISLSYGKRGPEFLGDIRRSRLMFDNGTIETQYTTTVKGEFNQLTIYKADGTVHRYFLEGDSYSMMLERYKLLWSGKLQGQSGLYSQLCNAFLIDDIYRFWNQQKPFLFKQSVKAAKYRSGRNRDLKQQDLDRMDQDWKALLNLHPELK